MSVLLNKGNGTFYDQVCYKVGKEPTAVVTCDVNKDGYIDMLMSSTSIVKISGMSATMNASQHISVLLNRGDGSFSTQVLFTVGVSPNSLIVSDVNNDSFSDIIVSNEYTKDVSVLINSGNL